MTLVSKYLINANFKNLQMDPNGNLIYTFFQLLRQQNIESKKSLNNKN